MISQRRFDCRLAIILAAGRGSRMGALTAAQPKCLVPLAGRAILSWTIDALRTNGIERIVAIGGWQGETLFGRVDDVRVNRHWERTNMVRSLLVADDLLCGENTLIVYGDGAYGQRAIHSALTGVDGDIVVPIDRDWMSLWSRRFANPLDDAETLIRDGASLVQIGSRATAIEQVQGQFMGLVRTTPAGWARIRCWIARREAALGAPSIDRLDTTGLLQGLIDTGEQIGCIEVNGGWVEIDSTQDISVAEELLDTRDLAHDFRH